MDKIKNVKEIKSFSEISCDCEFVISYSKNKNCNNKICSHPYYYDKKMAVPCNEENCKICNVSKTNSCRNMV